MCPGQKSLEDKEPQLTAHHNNCQNNQGGFGSRSHNRYTETILREVCYISARLGTERLKESLFPTPTLLVLGVWQVLIA